MKLSIVVATAVICCSVATSGYAGVVIANGVVGAPGQGKPVLSGGDTVSLDGANANLQSLPGGATLAAGFNLTGLISHLPGGPVLSGVFNKYTFTVGACIDSFVSSVLFSEDIVGINFSPNANNNAGIGLFVLGVEGGRFSFAGYAPFSSGSFSVDIYTATPALPATTTPEPSTFLVWGGLVALCGASRSLRRLF